LIYPVLISGRQEHAVGVDAPVWPFFIHVPCAGAGIAGIEVFLPGKTVEENKKSPVFL